MVALRGRGIIAVNASRPAGASFEKPDDPGVVADRRNPLVGAASPEVLGCPGHDLRQLALLETCHDLAVSVAIRRRLKVLSVWFVKD